MVNYYSELFRVALFVLYNSSSIGFFNGPRLCSRVPYGNAEITRLFAVSIKLSEGNDDEQDNFKEIAESVFNEGDVRPIILFDGVCNLCNGAVNFALDHDPVGKFRFAALQSQIGQSLLRRSGKDIHDFSSIVLVTPNKSYFKSDAVLQITKGLDGFIFRIMKLFSRIIPVFMRNLIYDFVSKNRHRFGKRESCRIDFDGEFTNRFVSG